MIFLFDALWYTKQYINHYMGTGNADYACAHIYYFESEVQTIS